MSLQILLPPAFGPSGLLWVSQAVLMAVVESKVDHPRKISWHGKRYYMNSGKAKSFSKTGGGASKFTHRLLGQEAT